MLSIRIMDRRLRARAFRNGILCGKHAKIWESEIKWERDRAKKQERKKFIQNIVINSFLVRYLYNCLIRIDEIFANSNTIECCVKNSNGKMEQEQRKNAIVCMRCSQFYVGFGGGCFVNVCVVVCVFAACICSSFFSGK